MTADPGSDAGTWMDELGELAAENLRLQNEIARLTDGADSTPPTEGVWLSPAQWIHRWNQLSAEQRLERAQHLIDNAQAATHCLISGHDARMAWLETRARAATEYEAALEEHGLLPDCPGFRTAAGLAADGSLPGRLHSLEEVAAEFGVDLDAEDGEEDWGQDRLLHDTGGAA